MHADCRAGHGWGIWHDVRCYARVRTRQCSLATQDTTLTRMVLFAYDAARTRAQKDPAPRGARRGCTRGSRKRNDAAWAATRGTGRVGVGVACRRARAARAAADVSRQLCRASAPPMSHRKGRPTVSPTVCSQQSAPHISSCWAHGARTRLRRCLCYTAFMHACHSRMLAPSAVSSRHQYALRVSTATT